MAEIKPLFGYISEGDGAVPEVVAEMEGLLEMARKGEIRGFGIAYIDGGEFVCTRTIKGKTTNGYLGGAIAMLFHEYFANWQKS